MEQYTNAADYWKYYKPVYDLRHTSSKQFHNNRVDVDGNLIHTIYKPHTSSYLVYARHRAHSAAIFLAWADWASDRRTTRSKWHFAFHWKTTPTDRRRGDVNFNQFAMHPPQFDEDTSMRDVFKYCTMAVDDNKSLGVIANHIPPPLNDHLQYFRSINKSRWFSNIDLKICSRIIAVVFAQKLVHDRESFFLFGEAVFRLYRCHRRSFSHINNRSRRGFFFE